jgi:hypothetical protein
MVRFIEQTGNKKGCEVARGSYKKTFCAFKPRTILVSQSVNKQGVKIWNICTPPPHAKQLLAVTNELTNTQMLIPYT